MCLTCIFKAGNGSNGVVATEGAVERGLVSLSAAVSLLDQNLPQLFDASVLKTGSR